MTLPRATRSPYGFDAGDQPIINVSNPRVDEDKDVVNQGYFIENNGVQPHDSTRTYKQGFIVEYQNSLYVAKADINSPSAFTIVDWEPIIEANPWLYSNSTAETLEPGKKYQLNTNSNSINLTLPSVYADGDEIIFADISNTADKNNITILAGSQLLDGVNANVIINEAGIVVRLVRNETLGTWEVIKLTGTTKFIEWETIATNTVLTSPKNIMADTTTSALNFTLPANAIKNQVCRFADYNNSFETNNCTILRGSHNIDGQAQDYVMTENGSSLEFTYIDAVVGWRITDGIGEFDDNVPFNVTGYFEDGSETLPSVTFVNSTNTGLYRSTDKFHITLNGSNAASYSAVTNDPNLTIFGTNSIKVPTGTTAQRPTGSGGEVRFNSETSNFEGYTDQWRDLGTPYNVTGYFANGTENDPSITFVNNLDTGIYYNTTGYNHVAFSIDASTKMRLYTQYVEISDAANGLKLPIAQANPFSALTTQQQDDAAGVIRFNDTVVSANGEISLEFFSGSTNGWIGIGGNTKANSAITLQSTDSSIELNSGSSVDLTETSIDLSVKLDPASGFSTSASGLNSDATYIRTTSTSGTIPKEVGWSTLTVTGGTGVDTDLVFAKPAASPVVTYGVMLSDNAYIYAQSDESNILRIDNGAASPITLEFDGDAYYTGTVYADDFVYQGASDRRLKTDINKISNALEIVNGWSGYKFKYNSIAFDLGITKDTMQVGLMVDEVEPKAPELIHIAPHDRKREDGKVISKTGENYKGIDYEKVVPYLVEAIKELNEEIKSLKEIIKNGG